MTIKFACALPLLFACLAHSGSVTIPFTLDHNRILIDVQLPHAGGSQTVRCWVDTGNSDLWISERASQILGLRYAGEAKDAGFGVAKVRKAEAPREIVVGNRKLPFRGIDESNVFLTESIGPGLQADINLPSSLLRNYDVIIDYPQQRLTLADPGSLKFSGKATEILINQTNGLIQVPSKMDDRACNLGLDTGATITFISDDVLNHLKKTSPALPQMAGAIAAANLWGLAEESLWRLLRIPTIQFGSAHLANVAVVSMSPEIIQWIAERMGTETAGLIGSNALLDQRIEISYTRKLMYLEKGTVSLPPDMDVVGLVLRPEPDGQYTILGVPEYEGRPAVAEVKPGDALRKVDGNPVTGSSMGKTWSLLRGNPGESRALTIERDGKTFTVRATVRRFLAQ